MLHNIFVPLPKHIECAAVPVQTTPARNQKGKITNAIQLSAYNLRLFDGKLKCAHTPFVLYN